MVITPDTKLDFSDVLIVPKRSELNSRSEVDITREIKCKHADISITCCPIIAANMYNTGTMAMSAALKKKNMLVAAHKFYKQQDWARATLNNLIPTTGINDAHLYDNIHLYNTSSLVCIDVPNGYISKVSDTIKEMRDVYGPSLGIIAGNVVTPNMTEQLILDGADVVKIGIGSGALCTTRLIAGVGYPQLSAIIECADAAHGLGGHIISDGGITCVGDICKAFCAGADFVMVGSMFVGYDENEGEWEYSGGVLYSYIPKERQNVFPEGREIGIGLNGRSAIATHNPELDKKWYIYPDKVAIKAFGMSSKHANEKFSGGLKDYRAAEGREKLVPYKGNVADFLQEIEGGLRSCGSYIGAKRLKDFPKCATFIQVNRTHNNMLEGLK